MLLVSGARAIDVHRGVAEPGDWLVAESGLLMPYEPGCSVPDSDDIPRLVVDDHYLVPGLIDAHVHLGRPRERQTVRDPQVVRRHVEQVALQTIRGGVTLVRDLGDRWPAGVGAVAVATELGAPRVVSALCGITSPDGYGRFLAETVRDTAGLLAAVRRRHEAGAAVVKLFLTGGVDFGNAAVGAPHFERATVCLAVEAAHELGMKAAVHANGPLAVMDAVLARADTVEHGILADDDCLRAMADRGTVWVPTLLPLWRALQESARSTDERLRTLPAIFDRHQQSAARAFDLGIRVVAGTDAGAPGVAHGGVAEEAALFAKAGVRPAFALQSVTSWAAEALGASNYAGSLASGRQADLLILRRNPLKDITALSTVTHVVLSTQLTVLDGGEVPV